MKTKYFIPYMAVIILLALYSCNKDAYMDISPNATTRADVKPWDIDFSLLDTTYFVSDKDVEAYIHFKKLVAEGEKREFEVREVVPMGLNEEATLAYLINYNEGWEIIAADKRAPTVLAADANGSLDIKKVPSNMLAWIQNLERDILFLRECMKGGKSIDNETLKNIQSSIDFWSYINVDKDYFEGLQHTTRAFGDLIIDPIQKPAKGGHWELVETWDVVETLHSTGRLTSTNFEQENYYNNCCPIMSPNHPYRRCLAGCVPVAAAQMAYYLHYKIGRPVTAPSDGHCYSFGYRDVGNFLDPIRDAYDGIETYNYNTTIWNSMLTNPISASYLIAEIGKRIETEYGIADPSRPGLVGSGARTFDLKDGYFSEVGVDCDTLLFSSSVVRTNLDDELPVIVDVQDTQAGNWGGHACIIDGYTRSRRTQKGLYTWVRDSMNIPVPLYDDEIRTIRVIEPEYRFHVNWGWGPTYNGSSSWYLESGNWSVGTSHFSERKRMVCNFGLAN